MRCYCNREILDQSGTGVSVEVKLDFVAIHDADKCFEVPRTAYVESFDKNHTLKFFLNYACAKALYLQRAHSETKNDTLKDV